jgi:transposase-like protein
VGSAPDPEVVARPSRRRFTAEYKRRILREADRCPHGQVAALLRREGLYTSHLSTWRRERDRAELKALGAKKRGRKATPPDPVAQENERLRRQVAQLERRLQQAETIIEVQKKVSMLLGIPLSPPPNDENG